MMDENVILMNEVENDGRKVHLYFNSSYNQYVAYGYSAYVVSKIAQGVEFYYDGDWQLPMVKLNDVNLRQLGIETCLAIAEKRRYVKLNVYQPFNEKDYDKWASFLRSQYLGRE